MAGIFEKTVVQDGLDMLAEETGERPEPNFYPVNLDLEGLLVTGLRVKTLSKDQIEAQKSAKGQVIGFIDVQIGGRLWISGLKIFRNHNRKQSVLLNPSTYSEKQEKWFTTVFFTPDDRQKILEEARRVAQKARQQRLAKAQ